MAEPPFLMRLAAHVAEVPESEDISGGQGHQVCFRRSGPPGVFSEFRGIRKENVLWCPGNIEIRGRFWSRGTREEKYAVVPRKLRRAGHQWEKCMQMPQKAVK